MIREARDLERKVPRMRLWFFPVSVPTALDFLALRLLFCVTPAFQNLADCQTVSQGFWRAVPLAVGRERRALSMLESSSSCCSQISILSSVSELEAVVENLRIS